MQRPENPAMTPTARVKIYAVIHRRIYELVSRAGPDRPVYVGSREWQQQLRSSGLYPGSRIPLSGNRAGS
jgi:hypothetical protein